MPTPSSPDVSESHSFGTTCPDDQTPHSQSGWQPPPPYSPSVTEEQSPDSVTVDDDVESRSRSTTMSPQPVPRNDGPAREPESMLPTQDLGQRHGISEADEDMAGTGQSPDHRIAIRDGQISAVTPEERRFGQSVPRRWRDVTSATDFGSRESVELDKLDLAVSLDTALGDEYDASMGSEFSSLRVIPTTPSSFLRPGSIFKGTQQSERQVYEVQVEIKHVDLRESFLCGYLRIQGLTEDHPTLTTYFEGEIIGSKYGFMTKHDSWGASDRIDLSHWQKFTAFRQFAKQAKKGNITIKDYAQKENIFMRWKEHFLVPNHRVRTITGASFEGFYYICFNQVEGKVNGIYFHAKSEKFQQLELKHVDNKGCFGAMEFR